jgi:hypothetical protein
MSLNIQIPPEAELLLGHPDSTGQHRVVVPLIHISSDEEVTVGEVEVDVEPIDAEADRHRQEFAARLRAAYVLPEGSRELGQGRPPLVLGADPVSLPGQIAPGSRFRITVRASSYGGIRGGKTLRVGPRTSGPPRSCVLTVVRERTSGLVPGPARGASRQASRAEYPGFIAIDLGTSNSTVTLHDRAVVEQITGLAAEQEDRLKDLIFKRIFSQEDASCLLPDVDPRDWDALLARIGRNLAPQGDDPRATMIDRIRGGGEPMLQALLQLEVNLGQSPCKGALIKALDRIYHEAFLEPRLRSQSLLIVPLDPMYQRDRDIVSALKLLDLDLPMDALMGRQVLADYRNAIAQSGQPAGGGMPTPLPAAVQQQYHLSPKRELIEDTRDFVVTVGGRTETRDGEQVVQAAYKHLMDRSEAWQARNPQACSQGRFTRAIVTYPTVAPPSIRAEVESLVRPLVAVAEAEGRTKADVVTDYDEAVAAALFYLHREFGGSVDLGPEAFKAMSRRSNDKWYQNVLVLDIGGGSTDLALLRLTLSEVDPFDPGEDRGAGGRCYVIEPRLLGSSGNLHLGGNLITLRLFQLLKAAIADRLMTAVQQGHLISDTLEAKADQLGEPLVDGNGRYVPGAILDAVANLPRLDPRFTDALQAAELVVPTRWKDDPGRLQAFYTIWEHAEAAKLRLGAPGKPEPYALGEKEFVTLLGQCGIPHEVADRDALTLELDARHFDRLAEPVVAEAVDIACGLLENGLTQRDEKTRAVVDREPLDWLILSGKTSNLDLVRRVIRREFIKSRDLIWNADRVTFVPEYAKLATSAGACYAEKMRRIALDPTHFKEELRRGLNQLTFNINNLFFFLPCSFLVPIIGGHIEIFRAGERLFRLDDEEVGKARSKPIGPQLLISVLRRDYPKASPILWGSFDGLALAVELGEKPDDFQKRFQIQFEVDYRLLMRHFIWEGPRPHYQIGPDVDSLSVAEHRPGPPADQETPAPGTAGCELFVNVLQAQASSKEPLRLISRDQPLAETFHYSDGSTASGLVVHLPDNFDSDGKIDVYVRTPSDSSLRMVGSLARPDGDRSSSRPSERYRSTVFPRRYSLSLDERGDLRVHLGEVPYWKTESFDEWKGIPGKVLQSDLGMVQPPPLEDRDPFCGKH